MKKLLVFLAIFLIGFSYFSQAQFLKKMANKLEKKIDPKSNTGEDSIKAETYPFVLQKGDLKVPENCGDYIWFKKGASMIYKTIIAEPRSSFESQFTVTNIYNEGNLLIADLEIKKSSNNLFVDDGVNYMKFKCSGENLYLDFAFDLKQKIKKEYPGTPIYSRPNQEKEYISLPKSLTPDLKLDDAVFSLKVTKDNAEIELTTSLTDRKVEGKETITTPAGTFECTRITGTRTNQIIEKNVTKKLGDPSKEYLWLSPKVGIVKQENHSLNGKLVSVNYLTSFKK